MDQPRVTYERDLMFAEELADIAAAITLPAFGGRMAVTLKADLTPVTESDLAAEVAMRAAVAAAYPRDAFLGEEQGTTGSGNRVWVVDPIDGTKNFADGVPLWTTLIALTVGGEPVAAVIDVPVLGERFAAALGGGATRDGEPIHVSGTTALSDAFVVHSGIEEWMEDGRLGDLERLARAARRTRGLSDAWGHCLVARGAADALVEHEPCGEWDYTAGKLIIEEAGGRLTTLAGGALHPGCDLLATNGLLHEEIGALMRGAS